MYVLNTDLFMVMVPVLCNTPQQQLIQLYLNFNSMLVNILEFMLYIFYLGITTGSNNLIFL